MNETVLGTAEVAALLGVSQNRVRAWAASGNLVAEKVNPGGCAGNNNWCYRLTDVQLFQEKRKAGNEFHADFPRRGQPGLTHEGVFWITTKQVMLRFSLSQSALYDRMRARDVRVIRVRNGDSQRGWQYLYAEDDLIRITEGWQTPRSGEPWVSLRGIESTVCAYIAGFIDGEGHIGIRRWARRRKCIAHDLRLSISNTDPVIIEWIKSHIGGYSYTHSPRSNSRRISYTLRWDRSLAAAVLECVEPYLVIKKAQAHLALGFQEHSYRTAYKPGERVSQEEIAWRDEQWDQMKALNHHLDSSR